MKEAADAERESIIYFLHAERVWPDKEVMPEAEARALRDRIINEIPGMDTLEVNDPFCYNIDYGDELELGDSPLVIRPGWQAAWEDWDRRWTACEMVEQLSRKVSVGEGNVLLDTERNPVFPTRATAISPLWSRRKATGSPQAQRQRGGYHSHAPGNSKLPGNGGLPRRPSPWLVDRPVRPSYAAAKGNAVTLKPVFATGGISFVVEWFIGFLACY
ncbi:MAG: hypothetical protein M2R45_03431 [Verrucomicrobia subdivision 3 bacterium]|nr:hypothetical protein [Limisphaerales bacterium]MCS1416335.1 hypothetical protein [Limisphaerales bacterium]